MFFRISFDLLIDIKEKKRTHGIIATFIRKQNQICFIILLKRIKSFTSQTRQEGHVHELQWKRSVGRGILAKAKH